MDAAAAVSATGNDISIHMLEIDTCRDYRVALEVIELAAISPADPCVSDLYRYLNVR